MACAVFLSTLQIVTGTPLERVPNTSLTMPSAPPTFGFASANALGTMTFTNPVCITHPPGETNRLFILEKRGRIIVITNLAAPNRTVFMDITGRVAASDTQGDERGLLGMAFHPGYATNRHFYVFYTGNATTPVPGGTNSLHDILARFEISAGNPNQGAANSEVRLITQRDEANNHNGGDLHFGPQDGYLYVSLGDEGAGNDTLQNSQRITKDYFSAIMRIDVDQRPGSLPPTQHPSVVMPLNYAVPPDNPFIGATSFNGLPVDPNNVRIEFWAVGLRNPWRMSFDPETGTLYIGDVGQGGSAVNSREEINIGVKGANYGWNYFEGFFQRTNSALIPAGFVHTPPLYDYPWGSGAAVTGGVLYRGHRLSQLYGAYVFADYITGQFRALWHSGNNVTRVMNLMVDQHATAFGVDPRNGDILYADVTSTTASQIKRINYSTTANPPIPPMLAGTGVFADLESLTPHDGIVPYDVNLPFWSDNAHKTRWFSVPNTNLTIAFNRDGNWSFPTGSVWIKHFELELTNGVPESRQRLETRLLVKNSAGAYGVTYRWSDSLTNAALVPEEGLNEAFIVDDGGGILRTQIWRYPSRVECMQCHTPAGGFALGFNSAQLNRPHDYNGVETNQIAALSAAGYFNTNVTGIHTLRALAHPTDSAVSREYRVRSYLAVNCAQCHQPDGPAQGLWDGRLATPGPDANLINGLLVNDGGNTNNRAIKPGSVEESMILTRISTLGPGRMPPLGSTVLDAEAIDLLSAWITNDLPSYQSFADWQIAHFGSTNAPEAAPDFDFDGDGANNYLEFLTQTDPLLETSFWNVGIERTESGVRIVYPHIANRAFEVQAGEDLLAPDSWSPLDVPGNAPFFPASEQSGAVEDSDLSATSRFYRVRVIEP